MPLPPSGAHPTTNGHSPHAAAGASVPAPPVVLREASAPRRWTPKALALAVICVVLGGMGVMIGVQSFAKRATVLAITKPVAVGSTIHPSDLTTARIASDPALQPVSADDRSSVIGKVALVDLRPGTLLTDDEIGTSDGFGVGQVLVPLPLKKGQFPARGLAPGQSVLVVATPGSDTGAGAGWSTRGPSTTAVVTEVGAADMNTGVTVVDVRVPASAASTLAQLGSTGNATVLLLPPGR